MYDNYQHCSTAVGLHVDREGGVGGVHIYLPIGINVRKLWFPPHKRTAERGWMGRVYRGVPAGGWLLHWLVSP